MDSQDSKSPPPSELPFDEKADTASPAGEVEVVPVPSAPAPQYLTGKKLFLVFTGFTMSVLLVMLDQTIVATALPRIASQFDALSQETWVASAYFLTQGALMLFSGQLMTVFPIKYVYLSAICVFETGSLLCAVSTSMSFLIFGRAFAGIGASGLLTSVLSSVAETTRLQDRPLLFGTFAATFAISAVIGPLLGGVLTDKASWRWCFYINLPLGAIAVVLVTMFMEARTPRRAAEFIGKHWVHRLLAVDWLGALLSVGTVVSLLLPLQWGGTIRPWNDPTIIALLVLFAFLLTLFILWEWKKGAQAMMPLAMFKRRSQVGACLEAFFLYVGFLVGVYNLPLLYQAKGNSAIRSGIDILPFMLASVICTFVVGNIVRRIHRYWPFLLCPPLLYAIGSGLLSTLSSSTPNARAIGFMILYGAGIGSSFQNTLLAIQAEYADEPRLIAQATSFVTFAQLIGGVVGLSISGSIFANQLERNIPVFAPGLSPQLIEAVRQSVTVIATLPEELRAGVIDAYIRSVSRVFLIGAPAGALASLSALLVKNYNLKQRTALMNPPSAK